MNTAYSYRPINMKSTGRRIRDMRMDSRITLEQLAEICCVTPQAVCKWQRGEALPSIDNLMVLVDLFHARVEDLIVRDDDRSSVVSGINISGINYGFN